MLEGLAERWRPVESEQGQEGRSSMGQPASCVPFLLKSVAFPKKDLLIRGKNPKCEKCEPIAKNDLS